MTNLVVRCEIPTQYSSLMNTLPVHPNVFLVAIDVRPVWGIRKMNYLTYLKSGVGKPNLRICFSKFYDVEAYLQ